IVDHLPDFAAIADMAGRMIYLNEAGYYLCGLDKNTDIRSLTVMDFMSSKPSFPDRMDHVRAKILSNGQWTGTGKLKNFKTGKQIPVQVKHFTVRDPKTGQPLYLGALLRDLTKDLIQEQKILNGKKQYQTLVEDMPVLICRFLADGTLTFANRHYCEYFQKKEEELLGHNFFEFIPESERERVKKHYESLTQSNPIVTYEHQVISPDKNIRWQRWKDRAVFDDLGSLMEYQSIGEDITETKRLQDELKHSEEQYRLLSESSPDFIFLISDKLMVEYVNLSAASLLIKTQKEIIGKPLKEFFSSDQYQYQSNDLLKVLHTQQPLYSENIYSFPEKQIWLSAHLVPIKNASGKVTHVLGISHDITAIKEIEKKLSDQLSFHQTLLDSIPDPIFYKDINGKFTGCNKAFEHMLGKDKSQILGKSADEITTNQTVASLHSDLELMKKRGIQIHEDKIKDQDGIEHEVMFHKACFYDSEKQLQGIIGVVHDISQIKKITASLLQSEKQYRTLVETLNELIFTLDLNGCFTYASPVAVKNFGYEPSSLIGRPFLKYTHPEDHSQILDHFQRSLKSKQEPFEFRVFDIKGNAHTIRGSSTPLERDGSIIGLMGFATDVTEQTIMEAALMENEEKFRNIFYSSPAALAYFDQKGFLKDFNKGFLNLFEISDADKLKGFSLFHDLNLQSEIIHEIKRGKSCSTCLFFDPEKIISFGNLPVNISAIKYLEIQISPLHAEKMADISGYLVQMQDITVKRKEEQELAEYHQKLEDLISEKTQTLRETVNRLHATNLLLSESEQKKSRFLATITHELRTPLNGILGFMDLLEGQHFGHLTEKQKEYINETKSCALHQLSLVNNLLDIAKIDSGGMDLKLEQSDISEFIDDVLRMLSSQFQKKRIKTNFDRGKNLPPVFFDQQKIKQILLNLISNAIKFTPEEGMISIRTTRDNDGILVFVSDTGKGIPPEEITKIFSEYYQTEIIPNESTVGTGIGLALTKKLVELHGGTIRVESELNIGSRFIFHLPFHPKPEKTVTKPEPLGKEANHG
ncbi:MAG: PAS domain S-box protein, partial [Candidatus Aureabacteria bacterium]|nr:PAS domain S-box protein [Candidatus Auribacterota bacterium]